MRIALIFIGLEVVIQTLLRTCLHWDEAEEYLTQYERLHAKASPERALVLRLPAAGLGNRLTASVSALVLGMLMKRPVFIDGGSYRFARLFSPRRLNWDADAVLLGPPAQEWGDAEVAGLLCRADLGESVAGPIRLTTGQYFLPHLQANPARAALFAAGGPLGGESLFGMLLRRYFTLVPVLAARAVAVTQEARAAGRRIVGLHLRDTYHTRRHKRRQLECAAHLASQFSPLALVFVSSDSAAWREAGRTWLGGPGAVLAGPGIGSAEDPQLHGDAKGLEAAAVELWVLGSCDDLVLAAGSTFSYVAQALQGRPGATVTRQGKCVRTLSPAPVSGRFPELARQRCWRASMWDVAHDQLCADRQCPIACAGKYEQDRGENAAWVAAAGRRQIARLSATQREERQERLMRNRNAFEAGFGK